MLKNEYKKLIKDINQKTKLVEIKNILKEFELKINDEKDVENFSKFITKKYKKIDFEKLPYVIEYYYSSENIDFFKIACKLLVGSYKKIPFLTNLEDIKLSKEKYLHILPEIIQIINNTANGISDCMYLIILRNEEYYNEVEEKYKRQITDSLIRIGVILEYLSYPCNILTKEIEYSLEIIVDVAKLYNNDEILRLVEKCLDLNSENVELFSLNTLIYNNIPVHDVYVDEIAKNYSTCNRLYNMLENMEKTYRFPDEYINQEQFALSEMVYWLMDKRELGKTPTSIEIVDKIKKDGYVYYIIKYKTYVKKYKEKEWLLGISGGFLESNVPTTKTNGYTFSDFEKFEEETYIADAKKLIEKIDAFSKGIY